jgi:hypothetical protein
MVVWLQAVYALATFLRAGAAATVSVVLLSRNVPAAGA